MPKTKKFLIIDANALIHRAFHALPPLKTKRGELVNAIYGFCLIFLKALKEIEPDFTAACFDLAAPTFRHKEFKAYKAKRVKAADELYAQIDGVKKVLEAFGVPVFEKPGFEADDLIGTLAKQAVKKQVVPRIENIILTGDLDALQLVNKQTKVYTMRKGIKDTVLYDEEKVKQRYEGLLPEQMVDFKALRGDPSDNIPGVTGIGEKTAIDLLLSFKTLQNLYAQIEQSETEKIKPAVLEKLNQYKEQAFFSQKLAQIEQNADIDFNLKQAEFAEFDINKVRRVFKDFEFFTLLDKIPGAVGRPDKEQEDLFGQRSEAGQGGIFSEIDKLKEQNVFSKEVAQLERDLVPVVEVMEKNGIKLDIKCLNKLSADLTLQVKELEKKIYQASGLEFNINSPQQLSDILFEKLGLSEEGLRKTPGGVISTGVNELKKLLELHPIIKLILDYRELFKLKSGFVDALPRSIHPKTGRIHPHFHQLGAETGRMSCSEPNLQNIPVKGELGRAIRRCFMPERGFVFLSADYSQMELRVAASMSQDKKMLMAFREGKDIHQITAQVIGSSRDLAKTINFGVLYGMGFRSVAERVGISQEEAKGFIKKYFEEFTGIAGYIEKAKQEVRQKGFSQTFFGRKRFLPEINSIDQRLKSAAERMAVNMRFQGTASDIMKMAMVAIDKAGLLNSECRMLLQIHDELLFEARKAMVENTALAIKKIMEEIVKLKASLRVDLSQGKNWGELEML